MIMSLYPASSCIIQSVSVLYFCYETECTITRQTDRKTDILLTEIKVITDLFVIVIREIYVHVYTRILVC